MGRTPTKALHHRGFQQRPPDPDRPCLCHTFPRLMALSILPLSTQLATPGVWQIVLVIVVVLLLFGGTVMSRITVIQGFIRLAVNTTLV